MRWCERARATESASEERRGAGSSFAEVLIASGEGLNSLRARDDARVRAPDIVFPNDFLSFSCCRPSAPQRSIMGREGSEGEAPQRS